MNILKRREKGQSGKYKKVLWEISLGNSELETRNININYAIYLYSFSSRYGNIENAMEKFR